VIRLTPPDVPAKLAQAAEDELARLKAKLAAGEAITTTDFKAYKTAGVREGLSEGFRFKCAYCESPFGATQPVAIEHYRPKSKVTTDQGDKPGYYWLAAKWQNLLPSCTDCNSQRQHRMAGVMVTIGKGNQFPIANEAKRASEIDGERNEGRLLLHPYLDRPERHLEFVGEGIVRPRLSSGRESSKGVKSIVVYALLRPKLVDARKERQAEIQGVMNVVAREAARLEANPGDAVQQQILDEEVARLKAYTDEGKPYSQMAKQMIAPFMEQLLA
jgi:uncharacterized protein (TIGR02646 family)